MDFKIQSRMKDPRVVPVSVNANGTLAIANPNVTVAKAATGIYDITLLRSFQQLPFAWATTRADGVSRKLPQINKAAMTAKVVRVKTYDLSDAAADAKFDTLIMGSDGREPVFNVIPQPVKIQMNRNRLLMFYFDGANNVQTPGFNPHEGTFEKTGTGLYTLTLRHPFFSDPYVLAVSNSVTKHVEVATRSGSEITFEVVNTVGAAAADTELFIMIVGQRSRLIGNRAEHDLLCPHPFLFLNPFEYDGSGDSMVRGGQYVTASKASTTYTFTSDRSSRKAFYGFATAGGAGVFAAVNNRTSAHFKVDVETAATVFGLEVGMRRGRDWV